MNGLSKRVGALEQSSKRRLDFLWVDYASDGGLVYDGKLYEDRHALISNLGHDPDNTLVMGWQSNPKTAAELLEEAAERAKNPPPEITLDELGEYGRKLVAEDGFTPSVAKCFELLKNETGGE